MTHRTIITIPKVLTTSALLLFCCQLSHAESSFEVTVGTSYSNNASKTDDATAIDERQDEIVFNTQWEKRFDFNAEALVNYKLKYEHFEKGSSEDEFNLNGNSKIDFVLSPNYSAQLNHSVRQLLKNPSVSETNDNLDDRSIYGAEFTAMYSPTSKQTIFLTPSIQEIDYKDNNTQNSSRIGLTGRWQLRLNSTSTFSVKYQTTQIDYEATTPDQDYDQLLFGYNKNHRLFNYNIDAGLNRYSSNGSDTEEPYFSANLSYNGNVHIVQVSASRILTDTSFGDGNLGDQLSSIDGDRINLEQLEQDKVRVSYQYLDLCRSCTLKLDLQLNNEDYTSAPLNDLEETIFSTSFEYKLDNKSKFKARFSHSDVEYSNQTDKDYELQKAALSYRKTINRDWFWLLFTEYEKKNSSGSVTPYSEWDTGIKVGYQF